MKKIIYIGAVLLGIGLSSCTEEWMNNVIPTDKQIDKDAFSSVVDGRNALNGVFSLMQSHYYYGADYLTYADLKGMDFRTSKVGKRTEQAYIYDETTEASSAEMWSRPYECLVAINNALVNADKMTAVTSEEKTAKEEIIANFYALRALCHFDLLKIYSRIPTAGNPATDLGVILADKVIYVKDQPQRATVKQVYDLIFADLAKAEKLPSASTTAGWFSLSAVKALKSRVCLYYGDKVEALKYAKDVIDNGGYSLVSKDKYAASWAFSYDNPEAIMTIICTENDNSGNEGIGYLMSETGYAAMKVTNSFKALLASDAGDVRSSIIDANDYLKKYPDDLTNVYRIIRLSEMYLIAAESTTSQTEAMGYLNKILKARGATEITDAATVDLDRILLERRKELAGEGHVFFDFMRNKKNIVHTGTGHLATLKPADYVFEYDDYRAIQPIPRNELNSNKVITQNPTYNAR